MVKDNKPEDFARQLLPFGSLTSLGKGAADAASTDQPAQPAEPGQQAQDTHDAEVTQPAQVKRGRGRSRSRSKDADTPAPAETSPASESAQRSGQPEQPAPVAQQDQPAQTHDAQRAHVARHTDDAPSARTVASPEPEHKEIADRRLHVLITPSEMAYLRRLAQRKAGELGKQFGGSASLGQVIRHLIQLHQENEGL